MNVKIKEELLEMQDIKYKEFHSKLCPETDNILRNYAKELSKKYPIQELLETIEDQYYEETMLKGMLIGLDKECNLGHIREFVPKINNWSVCDVFCAGLKCTKKHKKEMWELINEYLKLDKEFEIRFAVVMILDYYIEKEYLKQDFKIFDSINHEGYYVKMAVAWAVSIALVKFYGETVEYLKECKLDKFTYNKAIQKAIESYRITDEQKKQLRKMKKA